MDKLVTLEASRSVWQDFKNDSPMGEKDLSEHGRPE
jgi:hypothetical protein